MLTNAPLTGPLNVIKAFGADVPPDGPGQRGHVGIDLAAEPGTPVLAVQGGSVLRVLDDHPVWGRVVVLGHEWGQSVYTGLGGIKVVGGSAEAGQVVGIAGDSTGGATPHVHFGLRIQPFSFADGMAGYTDPQPYLDRLSTPRGAILGPHIIGGVSPHLDLLRRWQPRLITVLDPNPDEMARLRAACPQAVIIGRIFVPDSEVNSRIVAGPEIAAEWAHQLTMQRLTPHVNYWQIANEVLVAAADLPLLVRFEMRRMQLAAAAMFTCAIFAFSVGNPDLPQADRMAVWQLLYPALAQAEQGGHIVAVHQYGAPDLWGPFQDWYGYRLEHQVLPRLPFKKLQFAVTEYGIDGMIQGSGPHGWQSFADAKTYADQLVRSARYLERFSGRVLGYSVFTLGHNSPWQSYDIAGPVAERLASDTPRGTWQTAQVLGTGIAPGEPNPSTDPDAPPPEGPQPPDPSVIAPIVNPGQPHTEPTPTPPDPTVTQPTTPTVPTTPTAPVAPAAGNLERRVTNWASDMHLSIHTIEQRPDQPVGGWTGNVVYVVKDVFTTVNGSWDVNGEKYGAVQWAKDAYVTSTFTKAYEKTTLYGAVIGLDGQFVYGQEMLHWTGGLEKLTDLGNTFWTVKNATEPPGWSVMWMASSSSYDAEGGQSGPWCWTPNKLTAEVVCGGGLPNGAPVSIFVVWQAVDKAATATPTATLTPTPTSTPTETGTPTPTATVTATPAPTIDRRAGSWVAALNLGYVRIEDRPDKPTGGDYVYMIKDIFNTRDGSWEPGSVYGGIDAWARLAYLKPLGDPEYFDDAGGDHHLFGAVIDANGKLMKGQDFLYWSDGFAMLGNPEYNGYAVGSNGYRYPRTKDRSGWANIVLDPGSSYVPARGEAGPWCWTPRGLTAEVMCGGGMPAKLHISTFVVWQAVPRSKAPVMPPLTGDYRVFMPTILKPPGAQSR